MAISGIGITIVPPTAYGSTRQRIKPVDDRPEDRRRPDDEAAEAEDETPSEKIGIGKLVDLSA